MKLRLTTPRPVVYAGVQATVALAVATAEAGAEHDDETEAFEPADGTDEEYQEAEEFGEAWSEVEEKYEG